MSKYNYTLDLFVYFHLVMGGMHRVNKEVTVLLIYLSPDTGMHRVIHFNEQSDCNKSL